MKNYSLNLEQIVARATLFRLGNYANEKQYLDFLEYGND